ncbi:MAG: hypothetical protein O3B45_05185 [Bacteroidetes bacterium]|jgi:hypothetical protein|nr:hypothetical protein [Bacteroidota bacterium]
MIPGLIRTIGTILLVWFIFRWLDRIARRWNRRPSDRGNQPPSSSNPKQQASPKDQKLGDYVDFEELKDQE